MLVKYTGCMQSVANTRFLKNRFICADLIAILFLKPIAFKYRYKDRTTDMKIFHIPYLFEF